MVWGAFSAAGRLKMQFVSSRMKSADYIQVLETSLIPFLEENGDRDWIFQQDKAAIHVSRETKAWCSSNGVTLMDWPARSPDLNPIENLWGILVRKVYRNNRQFETVAELKTAIEAAWMEVEPETIKNLIFSMPNRIFQLISKHGNQI